MLSRVAERVYWMARYLERAENLARLMNVYSNMLLDLPRGTKVGWHTLIDIAGAHDDFEASKKAHDERTVMKYLLAEQNGISLLSVLAMARENARTTREIIPAEAFEQINNLHIFVKENSSSGTSRVARNQLLEEIISNCQQLAGIWAGTLSHNNVYRFIRMGRNLERADMTTRIVDVGSGDLLPTIDGENLIETDANEAYQDTLWMNVLRSLSAYQMYRQNVQDRVNAEDVVMFLLQDEEFPRSMTYCLNQVKECTSELSNNTKALRQVARALDAGRKARIPKLLSNGLFNYIDNLQKEIAAIHVFISNTWFLPRI